VNKIYFTEDIKSIGSQLPADFVKDAVVIQHEMYDLPDDLECKQVIAWNKYRGLYQELEAEKIVLIGLNRMIVPSNRCDFIHDYLTTLTPNVPKIVIDTAPFIGEPWRLFFHFLFSNTNKFGAAYSYPIEGEWQKWFYRDVNDCRLSGDNIKLFINSTYTDLERLTTTYAFYEPTDSQVEWYNEVKAHVFAKHSSPKMWITGLLGECNKHFGLKFDYDSYLKGMEFKLPDLKVYRFVAEEAQRRQDIYNAFTVGVK
jgi:hypothetical protein